MDKPFQRKGTENNTRVGDAFEKKARQFFAQHGIILIPNASVEIGISCKKSHKFDLGNTEQKVLVECKAHTWTEGNNIPSAKMTTWDQAMFYFYLVPTGYRKIFFVQKDFSKQRNETLAHYYVRIKSHLIPSDVEIWEFDELANTAEKII